MSSNSGKNVFVLAGIEGTFRTPVATTKDLGNITGVSPEDSNNIISSFEIGDRESSEVLVGNYDSAVGIDGELNSGAQLELFFGQSTDVVTTGDYKHTFVNRGTLNLLNTVSSFTFSENYSAGSDIVFTYAGSKINSYGLSVDLGGIITYSSEILASTVAVTTSAGTQVSSVTKKLASYHATAFAGDAGAEVQVGQTLGWSVDMTHNIDQGDGKEIGSRFNSDLIEKNFTTSAEITKRFTDTTQEERFLGGLTPSVTSPAPTSIILKADNGVTLGSGRVEVYVEISGGQYETAGRNVSQDGIVEASYAYIGGNIEEVYYVDQVATYF